jgi:hypothetical protein
MLKWHSMAEVGYKGFVHIEKNESYVLKWASQYVLVKMDDPQLKMGYAD